MMLKPETPEQLFLDLPTDHAIIEAQIDRWWRASDPHEKWAQIATTCTEFLEGEQFTAAEKALLQQEGRPCVTKNKLRPLFNIMLGYQRQNRYELKFMPGNDGTGSDEMADVLNAVSQQIDEINQSEWKDSQVFQDGLTTGRGFWDIRLSFAQNRLGNVAEACKDPFTIYLDPESDDYDPNNPDGGWTYFLENRWMAPVDIFMMYGKEAFEKIWEGMGSNNVMSYDRFDDARHSTSPERYFGLEHFLQDSFHSRLGLYASPWQHINKNRKLVRVLDCQHRELKRVKYFVDLETGDERVLPDSMPREAIHRIEQWAIARQIPIRIFEGLKKQVRWTVTAGDRVLWDEWSPYGNQMTIVPYFPYFRRGKTRGMLEDLLDPQREINKRASAMLHIIMTTANSGWIFEEGSLDKEMEEALQTEGSRPGLHLKYREGYNAPQRIDPGGVPTNLDRLETRSNDDLKEISGVNDSSLGNLDRVQSGRAIQARQRQTIVGAEPYFDNFARSRELKGRQRLYLIQNFYTEPRIVRSRIASNAEDQNIIINSKDAAGQIINNVAVGRYEIAIEEAPMSATFLQGQFQEALELLEKGVAIPPDILVDLSSMPNKQEIKERLNEERLIAQTPALLQNIGMRSQMGLPMDQPPPPIVAPEQAAVMAPAPQMPMGMGQPQLTPPPPVANFPQRGAPAPMPQVGDIIQPTPPTGPGI